MPPHVRIARPVSELEKSLAMYCRGLGLSEIGRFDDHAGFDGVMLGRPGMHCHFEFTRRRSHPVPPSPTPEDLIVFYLPHRAEWQRTCESMLRAGFKEVPAINPYWGRRAEPLKITTAIAWSLSRPSGRTLSAHRAASWLPVRRCTGRGTI